MPIKASCACGAAFAARDDLAGRTVACPKCKQPLTIPAAAVSAPAAAPVPHANADLFDGLGLKARDESQPRCPGCSADMPPNAVLCVKCGYNVKLGKRMQTISMSGETPMVVGGGGHGDHGGATALLMARAAQAAEEDQVSEKAKTSEGMPVWVWIVGLLSCVLFGVVMSLIPQSVALFGTGMVLLMGAGLLTLFSWISIIVAAAKRNPLFGIGIFVGDIIVGAVLVLLGWLVSWATESDFGVTLRIGAGAVAITYALMRTEECAQFLLFMWISKILLLVAWILLFVASLLLAAAEKEGVSFVPSPLQPTAMVVERADGGHIYPLARQSS
jgi:hypothetical protein